MRRNMAFAKNKNMLENPTFQNKHYKKEAFLVVTVKKLKRMDKYQGQL